MATVDGNLADTTAGFASSDRLTAVLGTYSAFASGDTTAPTVGAFTPSVGSPLTRTTPVVFTVSDTRALAQVIVTATFVDGRGQTWQELVFAGGAFVRGYLGAGNSVLVTVGPPNNYAFSVLRDGGWPYTTTLTAYAVDTAGNSVP